MAGGVFIDRAKFLAVAASVAAATSCSNYHTVAAEPGGSDASDDAARRGPADSGSVESGTSCGSGKTMCGGSCVDTANDPHNCGACSKACSTAGSCWSGECCYPATEGFGGGTCIVYPACGCSADQNCARINGAPEQCVPNGSTPQLGTCGSTRDCQHGFACADGVCDPLCGTCGTNYVCLTQFGGSPSAYLGYSVCEPHCNPVYPFTTDASHVACGAGQRCQMSYNAQGGTFCEASIGAGGQGATCPSMYGTACKAGYECVNYMGGGTYECVQYCRVGFSDCLTGSCVAFQTPAYDGTTQIGVCE